MYNNNNNYYNKNNNNINHNIKICTFHCFLSVQYGRLTQNDCIKYGDIYNREKETLLIDPLSLKGAFSLNEPIVARWHAKRKKISYGWQSIDSNLYSFVRLTQLHNMQYFQNKYPLILLSPFIELSGEHALVAVLCYFRYLRKSKGERRHVRHRNQTSSDISGAHFVCKCGSELRFCVLIVIGSQYHDLSLHTQSLVHLPNKSLGLYCSLSGKTRG